MKDKQIGKMFLCGCNFRKTGTWNVPQSPANKKPIVDEIETEVSRRRSGLAGHTSKVDNDIQTLKIVKHPKDIRDEQLITEALLNNEFLRNLLEEGRLQAVVDAMYSREVKSKDIIITEGTVGTHLYVSASGTYEIFIKGKIINTFSDNRVFGELAILYDAKRQATIKVAHSGKLWVLDQNVYQHLMLRSELERQDQLVNFITKVPKLNTVPKDILTKVSELLKREFFPTGHVIIREGEQGDKFYIISAGTVTISKEDEQETGIMGREEFFGQLALLTENNRRKATVTANAPGVECFSLASQEFIDHFGTVEDITSIPDLSKKKITDPKIKPYQDVQLEDLKRIETLGVGAFGRVDLVQHKDKTLPPFALKYLKKLDMIQQQQQEHVYNEKNVQMNCNSIFIPQLFKTFKDKKYLYFLMEACLGGDLWSLLQRQKYHRFEEEVAKFYSASVLEALTYLHERGIVYRDLKPENLLLDSRGYLKLSDFGFAKVLGSRGKTYTFAGTPEYVAPEVVLNKGHNQAVDYWGLGIFVFELLVGKTPFRSNDTSYMKTYNLILRGIENVRFPESVPRKAEHLVKKLCRALPLERLGCQKEGAQAVRDHKWFTGFEWDKLREGLLEAPFKRTLKNNIDTQYFDRFPKDTDVPPDESSGWDKDF